MTIKTEINGFNELYDMAWSGALDVCQEISKQDREDEAMCLIEDYFADYEPTATELNDFVWFTLDDLMGLWDDDEDNEESSELEEDDIRYYIEDDEE